MAKRKIILFGGTFDPVHLGHCAVALTAMESIGAEKIIFVPAKLSPLKKFFPIASGKDRMQMITLAIAEKKNFDISDYELKKSHPSYTLETVRHFQAEYGPYTALYWLIGADSINELQYWHKITELIDECNLCAMYRGGFEPPDFTPFQRLWQRQRVKKLQQNIIQTPLIDISSTQIRNKLKTPADIAEMLHPSVANYIQKHNLYKPKNNH